MPSPARPRFRPARQARSRRTLGRILGAARELAREGGMDAVTVQAVTRRSGVSTGSFYARFAGREALLHHMENRFWGGVEELWRRFLEPGRWRAPDVVGAVSLLVRTVGRGYRRGAPELRAYLLHALAHPDRKPLRRAAALERAVAGRVAELLRPGYGAMRHPRPEAAAEFAMRELLASLRAEVLFAEPDGEGARDGSDGQRDLERARMFLAYLGVDGVPGSEDELRSRALRARGRSAAGS